MFDCQLSGRANEENCVVSIIGWAGKATELFGATIT